jgi:tetratricopeptide (TPR) repeat protein
MTIKKLLSCAVGLLFFLNLNYSQSPINLKEIEDLLSNEKYSIALEKSLNLINTRESELTPIEAGTLHYFIGLAYKKNGNQEMAANYLKKIEQQFPASKYLKNSFLELADIYKDDYFQKETYLEKVFEQFPRTDEAVKAGIELSKGYLKLKNFKKSLPVLEKMVTIWKVAEEAEGNKEYDELYMMLALAYSGINDYIEAIDYLRIAEKRIEKTINTNPLYLFEAGKICHNNQNFEKAITYLVKLINVYPDYRDVLRAALFLAQAYERQNNLFMSAIYLIKAAEKNPTDQNQKYDILLNLGRILGRLEENELGKIRKTYPLHSDPKKTLTMVKKNSPVFEQRRNATIFLSNEYKKVNDLESMIDNYYQFLRKKRDPLVEKIFKENLNLYIDDLERNKSYDRVFKFWVIVKNRKSLLAGPNLVKLGQILYDTRLYLNAEEIYNHLQKYTMFSKYRPVTMRQLARIYFKIKKNDDYLSVYDKLELKTDEEKNEFLFYNLHILKEQDKKEELKKVLKEVTIQKVTNNFLYNIMEFKADDLVGEKKHSEALNIYLDMMTYPKMTDDSRRFDVRLKIADIYYYKEEWESAFNFYTQAEKFRENDEWVLFRKIGIYLNTGRKKEARETLKKLKETNPNSFWIRQAEKNVR